MSFWLSEFVSFFIVFMIPFLLIVIFPFTAAYIKGEKDLKRAKTLYIRSLKTLQKRIFANRIVNSKISQAKLLVENALEINDPPSLIQLEISLVERRTYVYYLYKLFRQIPDIIILRATLEKSVPVTPTYLIPKRQRKLLSKIMPYLSELEEIRIKGLSDKAVIVSADPRYTIHYFDRKILSEILRIMPNLNYLFIDVAEPHLEINCSLREKEAKKVLNDLLTLCMDLLSRIIKIRKGGREVQALKYIRKLLTSS
ncbi:MAG: hypothetical protein ACTSVA_05240 [Candidatus Njordarchaeales archaeon]